MRSETSATWNITWKDLRLLARDRRALIMLLLLPLMFIAILGMSTGQFLTKDKEPRQLRIATVDEGRSEPSQDLVKALSQHEGIRILEEKDVPAAKILLEKNEASVLLIIPDSYEAKVDELRMGDILDSANGQLAEGPIALGLTFEFRSAIGESGLVKWLVFSDALRTIAPVVSQKNAIARRWIRNREEASEDDSNEGASENAEKALVNAPAASVVPDDTAEKVYLILVPGFTVMFVFFLINIMARSFIAERDQGTLRRLRLAPVSSASILIGKTLPYYLISVVQTALLFLCGRIMFGMSWGPEPAVLIPVILCTSLAATSLGLLLATLVHTEQQVSSYGTALVLVLGGVSGCLFPRVWLPAAMKKISFATPHAWSLEAFDAVLSRSTVDYSVVVHGCFMLLMFTGAFFLCGWWRFRTTN